MRPVSTTYSPWQGSPSPKIGSPPPYCRMTERWERKLSSFSASPKKMGTRASAFALRAWMSSLTPRLYRAPSHPQKRHRADAGARRVLPIFALRVFAVNSCRALVGDQSLQRRLVQQHQRAALHPDELPVLEVAQQPGNGFAGAADDLRDLVLCQQHLDVDFAVAGRAANRMVGPFQQQPRQLFRHRMRQ